MSDDVRLLILGLANGKRAPASGQWVERYTADGFDGRGDLVVTRSKRAAKVYPSAVEALEEWRRVSSTHPTRADGKPNRPLTAFSVKIVK